MEARLRVAAHEPYRPRLFDPSARREDQQRRGMFVQGEDPTAGIRPLPKQKGLYRQYRVPGTLEKDMQFTDILAAIKHYQSNNIDTVDSLVSGAYCPVTFYWTSPCDKGVKIIGEFNGWQPEDMLFNFNKKEYSIIKNLAAGRYRYRYIVDDIECINQDASIIHDNTEINNIILICNPMLNENENENSLNSCVIIEKPEVVNLNSCNLGDDGVWSLSSALLTNNIIHTLDLSYNSISDDGMISLCHNLPNLHILQVLKLNGNGFGYDSCRYLTDALKDNITIHDIELARNNLGDDSAEEICRLITYHKSIKRLYLDGCYIGNDGMDFIGQSLEKNRTLETLSLSGNQIGPLGAGRLAFYLRRNSTLIELRLDSNPLGPSGNQYIGDMLGSNVSISILNVSNTGMMRGSAHHGLHALMYSIRKNNRTLRTLSFRNNMITNDNATEIARTLQDNKGILSLDLSGNLLDSEWFAANTYLTTKGYTNLPSIRTSLDTNNSLCIQEDIDWKKRYKKPNVLSRNLSSYRRGPHTVPTLRSPGFVQLSRVRVRIRYLLNNNPYALPDHCAIL